MLEKAVDSFHPLPPCEQRFTSIPKPRNACELHVMRIGTLQIPGFLFVQDLAKDLLLPSYSFLIVHKGERYLFDLGLRKDLAFNDRTKRLFTVWPCQCERSAREVLEESSFTGEDIKEIIFSHLHFDHIGDVTEFPTTPLVFGKFQDTSKVQDTTKLAGSLQVEERGLTARKIVHLSDRQDWMQVGSLHGIDYFGDGSLYLLDTPGHMDGHLAALVCISTKPEPLYHLLAGDAAHVVSLIDYESPAHIGIYKAKDFAMSPYAMTEPEKLQSFEEDIGPAYDTMAKLARMDHEANINVLLAHDGTLDAVFGEIGSLEGALPLASGSFTQIKQRSRIP